jgi:hypothetical protein
MGQDLTNVEVTTREGAVYAFPDMPHSTLETVLQHSNWVANGVLILVNVSGALLSLPARVVDTISWDGKVQYHGPALY